MKPKPRHAPAAMTRKYCATMAMMADLNRKAGTEQISVEELEQRLARAAEGIANV